MAVEVNEMTLPNGKVVKVGHIYKIKPKTFAKIQVGHDIFEVADESRKKEDAFVVAGITQILRYPGARPGEFQAVAEISGYLPNGACFLIQSQYIKELTSARFSDNKLRETFEKYVKLAVYMFSDLLNREPTVETKKEHWKVSKQFEALRAELCSLCPSAVLSTYAKGFVHEGTQ